MAKLDQISVNGTTYELVPEVAPLFNTSTAYAVGDYVIKDAVLYRFKATHTSGAWSASQVDEVTAGSELKSIKNDKLDKNQGTANAGKYLKVGADGNVETADLDVTTDKTLSITDKAADAKAVGDELTNLKADLDTSFVSNGETLEWELGSIYNGNEEDSTTVIRCDFVKIPKGTLIHKTNNNYNYRVQVYNFNKIYLKDYSHLNWTNDDFIVNMDGYLRLCIKKSTSAVITNDEIPTISSYLKVTFSGSRYLFSKIIENADEITESKTEITTNATKTDNLIKSEKFSAYIGAQGIITFETESSGRTKLYFTKELIVRYSSNSTPISFNQATVLSMLGSNAEAYGDSGFIITLPTYASLVMRITDNRLLIMSTHSATQIHIVLMSNGYGMPNGYLYNQVINNKIDDIAINKMFVSSYNRLGDNWKIHAKNFSDLFNNAGKSEGFLFFTDCHMFHGSRWEELAHPVMSWIEQLFYASPCNFVLNGGDWLGSYDSQNTALYKLGFISGMMRKKFGTKYAMLLGNHETNYTGYKDDQYDGQTQEQSGHALDGTLIQNSINATYFADFGSGYYKYKCKSFDLYCFDTGIESSGLTDDYYKNQVKWYANSLKANDTEHIAIALHIIVNNSEIMPMFDELCKCSKAFNDRTAYAYDGETYDYTSVTGKVAFAIGGHTHADMSGEHNGIPYIITKNTTDYGAYADLPLDMVKVDWTAKKLTAYRATTGNTYTVREISILT